jgi:hypothetical protein
VGAFVIDVQARDNSFSDNARAASAVGHSRSLQLAAEDQLHLLRSAQIDILTDDLLKEVAPAQGAIPNLGQGKLRLQYG